MLSKAIDNGLSDLTAKSNMTFYCQSPFAKLIDRIKETNMHFHAWIKIDFRYPLKVKLSLKRKVVRKFYKIWYSWFYSYSNRHNITRFHIYIFQAKMFSCVYFVRKRLHNITRRHLHCHETRSKQSVMG